MPVQHLFAISTNGVVHRDTDAPAIAVEVSPRDPAIVVLTFEGGHAIEVYGDELIRAVTHSRVTRTTL